MIVSARGVKKYFGNTKAVDGVDLHVAEGEYLALLGPNGAGKTTMVEMIEGIQQPDEGEIQLAGKSWNGNKNELHNIIGLSLQETRFIEKYTVDETLNLFASFYDLDKERIEEVLVLVGLKEKRGTYSKNLSGGQKQKLALGIAILNNPKILLLDEPTTGLDPTARRELWEILRDLKKKFNTSMILTTHYMEEASFLCDRIVIIDNGKVLAEGTLEDLLAQYKDGEIISFTTDKPINPDDFPNPELILYNHMDSPYKGEVVVKSLIDYLPGFLAFIEKNDLSLTSLECRKMTLDDLFISMTGRHLNE